jgi:hypothetical protein
MKHLSPHWRDGQLQGAFISHRIQTAASIRHAPASIATVMRCDSFNGAFIFALYIERSAAFDFAVLAYLLGPLAGRVNNSGIVAGNKPIAG